ncbi:MAG: T9SS type A sorting domain-containing protein [Ignavibacteriaceae bacterium]|nr:T9SS type A sorting domain-containing protein [Ignavibacteriaceae bacterium]
MRSKFLFSMMLLFIIAGIYVPASYSQPLYTMTLANDTLDATGKIYTVDIMFLSRDTAPVELAALSMGLHYNDAARNGGTITYGWVAGSSSQLTNTAQVPGTPNGATTTTVNSELWRVIKVAAKSTPGTGNGSLLSNVGAGTRIGRLMLTNTAQWLIAGSNTINWEFTAYPTTVNAYVAGINTLIGGSGTTNKGTDFYNTVLAGPLLPVELTSFLSEVNGRQVNLSWETKTEINSSKFEIDRATVSTKGVVSEWSTVGSVSAAGSSFAPKKYNFTEKNLQGGKYQYRLKMIDNDGTTQYSKVVESEVALPKEFAISQNYPNPFNPTTKIDYQVPVDAKVILEVYNITGQKVVELVNQDQQAGYYTVNFGSSNKLSSGVYIYRIIASDKVTGSNFSSIKKMMLLK